MNAKNLSIVAIVLWIVGAATVTSMFIGGNTEQDADGRKAVILLDNERTLILGEMRNMLASVQDIVVAIAEDDLASVAKIALAVGNREAAKVPKSLMLKLPQDFKAMAKQMHSGFDQIAVQSNAGSKAVLGQLGELMGNCVACHESYSLKAK